MRWAGVLAFLTFFALPSISAGADGPDRGAIAEPFFRAATAAYERGAYSAAALAFEQAYQAAPSAAAAFNAARSWELSGDTARAAEDYAKALTTADLDATNAAEAHNRLDALAPSLSRVDVDGPRTATVSIDGVDRGYLPQHLYMPPGLHRLLARRLDGSVVERSVALAATESLVVTIEDVRPPPHELGPVPISRAPNPESHGVFVWGWATLGATALLTAAGTITYFEFEDALSNYNQGGRRSSSLRDRAVSYQDATYVLWGLATAGVVASAVAWLAPRASKVPIHVGLGWVILTGRF